MSSFAIVQDVSVELRRRIFSALIATAGVDFGLNGDPERIRLGPPTDATPPGVIGTLFLYHIDIDRHQRNQRPLPDRNAPDQFRRPPLPLQLRYLLAPLAADERTGHLLIGRVLQHFHDAPFLDEIAGRPLGDSFGGASPAVRVRPEMLSIEQLSQLWNALSTPFRLSIGLMVETVAVDSGEPPQRVGRVAEVTVATGVIPRRAP